MTPYSSVNKMAAVPKQGASAPWCAAKVVASVEGLCALGVWCRVCSVSRNFVMEKQCLEDSLVKGLYSYVTTCSLPLCGILCNNGPLHKE